MILDNFSWRVSGFSWALTRLYYTEAPFVHHLLRLSYQSKMEQSENKDQVETDSIKQPLCACAEASHEVNRPRTNVLEEVSAAEDADQVLISTNNDLFSAKQITAAVGARQWIGQMNEASIQHLSQSRRIDSADHVTIDKAIEPETERAVNFVKYGAGYKLERDGV